MLKKALLLGIALTMCVALCAGASAASYEAGIISHDPETGVTIYRDAAGGMVVSGIGPDTEDASVQSEIIHEPEASMVVPYSDELNVTEEQLAAAAAPYIEANSEFYDIEKVTFSEPYISSSGNGGYYAEFYVTLEATLKYESAAQLPQIMGLAYAMGIDSSKLSADDLIAEISCSNISSAVASSLNSSLGVTDVGTANIDNNMAYINAVASVVSEKAADFILSCEENIGESNEFNVGLRAEFDVNGNLLDVDYEMYEGYADTMEYVAPQSAEEMFENGKAQYANLVSNAVKMVNESGYDINSFIYEDYNNIVYDGSAASDYANTYTSNPAKHYCSTHKKNMAQDTSKYNSDFTWYCCKDCANYVSQAMNAGGIPITSTWNSSKVNWTSCTKMEEFFTTTTNLWETSSFSDCPDGGIIIATYVTTNAEGEKVTSRHAMMCVENNTVTRRYSAHTNDRLMTAFTSTNYFGAESVAYYKFKNSN